MYGRNNRQLNSAKQDETALLCRLILFYTVRKVNQRSQTAREGLTLCNTITSYHDQKEKNSLLKTW